MKIAILSDIHGNMIALNAVMDDIQKNGCDKTFFLGDYALAGPEPAPTVDYCMHLNTYNNIEMIQGNTDKMIAEYNDEMYNNLSSAAPIMANALREDVKILNDNQKAFLRDLPPYKLLTEEGIKILLVHGSPRRNNEDILPDTPIEEVEKMLVNVDADVVLCGHTHLPCGFQTSKKKTVVNAGSIGRPFTPEPKSCYLTIIVNNGECLFEHHFVEYKKERASAKLRKREFEGADKLANMLLNPKVRHF